ncbi:MAG: DegT/DnrJ/eryc1/StrS aminotransferase [uncultured bacterium]|nr:MAG: DegT/DnrJ/eryc1/StrS aminotransferase [uncultured bacterium]
MTLIFRKTIFTGFAPNLTGRDTRLALSYLLFPWKWSKINSGENVEAVERSLEKYFDVKKACVFDSGRSALLYALKSLDVSNENEVLVQGYTCMVVVNSIVQSGAKPIYVDVENDLNMSAQDLEKKITPKSKVLIIQHTFGMPADVEKLMAIAKKHNLLVIEDCAHSFGAKLNGKLLGTFADIGMLSFGADKIVSSVRGGALITNDLVLGEKIEEFQNQLQRPNLLKTVQHLMHHPVFFVGKKLYHIYIGKILLFVSQKLGIINKIIYDKEKRGEQTEFYPSKFANSLADILLNQISEVDVINNHRKQISNYYDLNINNKKIGFTWDEKTKNGYDCIYLRYPILMDNSTEIFSFAKKRALILGNWYDRVIVPGDIDFEKTKYVIGSCPNAEQLAKRAVNLPTDRHISMVDAKRIVEIVNSF